MFKSIVIKITVTCFLLWVCGCSRCGKDDSNVSAEFQTKDNKESVEFKKDGWFTNGCSASPTGKGGPMCAIPSGDFGRGCNEAADKECAYNENPYKQVYLSAYYLDRHEVTADEYKECVSAGVCKSEGLTMPYYLDKELPDSAWACNWNNSGRGNHPINCIPWQYAADYCQWAGKRLPTEAEWEKGARGTDGRKYSWGNEGYADTEMVANIADETAKKKESGLTIATGYDDGYFTTSPVEAYPRGKSPYGLYDMIGNVWEWTDDWYESNYYSMGPIKNPHNTNVKQHRVLRGGSWETSPSLARVSFRSWDILSNRSDYNGFRCAVSSPSDF